MNEPKKKNEQKVRYYLVKEVNGVVVRKTEITLRERDVRGRWRADDVSDKLVSKVRKAKNVRCPNCGYVFACCG